jgi:sugar lactone lactonase YvrE
VRALCRAAIAAVFLVGLLEERAQAHPGTGIVVDRGGRIFFTDLARIWRLDPDGRLSVAVPSTHTHELYMDAAGNLFGEHLWYESGSDRFRTRAWKLAPDGKVSKVLPPTKHFPAFVSPIVDAAGNRYVADVNNNVRETSRIFRTSPAGDRVLLAGGAWGQRDGRGADARFGSIGGMAVGADGNLYVSDGPSIRKVFPDGRVTTIARDGLLSPALSVLPGGRSNHLMGIAVDSRGTVFVANHARRSVVAVNARGRMRTLARAGFPWSPTGVTATAAGDLLVLEYRTVPPLQAVRVRRIGPDGKAVVLGKTRGSG